MNWLILLRTYLIVLFLPVVFPVLGSMPWLLQFQRYPNLLACQTFDPVTPHLSRIAEKILIRRWLFPSIGYLMSTDDQMSLISMLLSLVAILLQLLFILLTN